MRFSTLYGSKWVATRAGRAGRTGRAVSVPSTGRSGLQAVFLRVRMRRKGCVSVPSTGRSGLQPALPASTLPMSARFSTLYGSKWVATSADSTISFCFSVSVPSTGRSGLQPKYYIPLGAELRVSVPSTGRSGLQRWELVSVKPSFLSFSTLYGSKWVATLEYVCVVEKHASFQYPLRVEVGCNSRVRNLASIVKLFQYPLRVEVGCNTDRDVHTILDYVFQYPLRVEVGCNRSPKGARDRKSVV